MLLLSLFFSFKKNYFNWRWITLWYCGGFCPTFTWTSHGCACVSHPEPSSHLPAISWFLFSCQAQTILLEDKTPCAGLLRHLSWESTNLEPQLLSRWSTDYRHSENRSQTYKDVLSELSISWWASELKLMHDSCFNPRLEIVLHLQSMSVSKLFQTPSIPLKSYSDFTIHLNWYLRRFFEFTGYCVISPVGEPSFWYLCYFVVLFLTCLE